MEYVVRELQMQDNYNFTESIIIHFEFISDLNFGSSKYKFLDQYVNVSLEDQMCWVNLYCLLGLSHCKHRTNQLENIIKYLNS